MAGRGLRGRQVRAGASLAQHLDDSVARQRLGVEGELRHDAGGARDLLTDDGAHGLHPQRGLGIAQALDQGLVEQVADLGAGHAAGRHSQVAQRSLAHHGIGVPQEERVGLGRDLGRLVAMPRDPQPGRRPAAVLRPVEGVVDVRLEVGVSAEVGPVEAPGRLVEVRGDERQARLHEAGVGRRQQRGEDPAPRGRGLALDLMVQHGQGGLPHGGIGVVRGVEDLGQQPVVAGRGIARQLAERAEAPLAAGVEIARQALVGRAALEAEGDLGGEPPLAGVGGHHGGAQERRERRPDTLERVGRQVGHGGERRGVDVGPWHGEEHLEAAQGVAGRHRPEPGGQPHECAGGGRPDRVGAIAEAVLEAGLEPGAGEVPTGLVVHRRGEHVEDGCPSERRGLLSGGEQVGHDHGDGRARERGQRQPFEVPGDDDGPQGGSQRHGIEAGVGEVGHRGGGVAAGVLDPQHARSGQEPARLVRRHRKRVAGLGEPRPIGQRDRVGEAQPLVDPKRQRRQLARAANDGDALEQLELAEEALSVGRGRHGRWSWMVLRCVVRRERPERKVDSLHGPITQL